MNIPWKIIAGYGAHIKATPHRFTVSHKGRVKEYDIRSISHLLIVGGHTIQTGAINNLIDAGVFISFFKSDGEPSGYIKPYGSTYSEDIVELQKNTEPFSYAVTFAKAAMQSKILAIETKEFDDGSDSILYSGELELLHDSLNELDYLIKIDEIRRIDRLVSDMYYEIMARTVVHSYGFKRRTERPYMDVINAMLGFGYGMLIGNCKFAIVGAHLDPDCGVLHKGKAGLSMDFANVYLTKMVDQVVFNIASDLCNDDFECGKNRCILSDSLIKRLIYAFRNSIDQGVIDNMVLEFVQSMKNNTGFDIR